METQVTDQSSWNVGLEGPLAHPWGEAKIAANWSATDAGFASLQSAAPVAGTRAGQIAVQQDVETGLISGTLTAKAAKNTLPAPLSAAPGADIGGQNVEGNAQFKLALTPNLAVIASGGLGNAARDFIAPPSQVLPRPSEILPPTSEESRMDVGELGMEMGASGAPTDNPNEPDKPSQATAQAPDLFERPSLPLVRSDSLQTARGDVGLELKLSSSLAITATSGRTTLQNTSELAGWETPTSQNGEKRIALGLQQRTKGGSWGLKITQKMWDDAVFQSEIAQNSFDAMAIRLGAERRLIGAIRLKGAYDWARHDSPGQNEEDTWRVGVTYR